MWDLWRTEWHWDRDFPLYSGFPPVSIVPPVLNIHSFTHSSVHLFNDGRQSQQVRVLLNNALFLILLNAHVRERDDVTKCRIAVCPDKVLRGFTPPDTSVPTPKDWQLNRPFSDSSHTTTTTPPPNVGPSCCRLCLLCYFYLLLHSFIYFLLILLFFSFFVRSTLRHS